MQPPHKADLTNPDLTVLVQVVKDACAIGVAARYRDLSKYNLRELCNPDAGKADKPASKDDSTALGTKDTKPEDEATDGDADDASKLGLGKSGSETDGKLEAEK